mmetsp:Transcript_13590/g.19485  ORF Transcript_13590/g.19485 Transcript_13590/m.19485 type:complete len:82 (-) Transcript_13590:2252-2497(-)
MTRKIRSTCFLPCLEHVVEVSFFPLTVQRRPATTACTRMYHTQHTTFLGDWIEMLYSYLYVFYVRSMRYHLFVTRHKCYDN